MATGYEKRYAGMTREQCHTEAKRLCAEVTHCRMKWEELPERLLELRKVGSYAPAPVVKRIPVRVETLHAPHGIVCDIAPRGGA